MALSKPSLFNNSNGEEINYSIMWYNSTELVGSIFNSSFSYNPNPFLSNLTNSTTYYINLTVWDTYGCYVTNNTFDFTTAINVPGTPPAVVTVGRRWNWGNKISKQIVAWIDEVGNFNITGRVYTNMTGIGNGYVSVDIS